jgi:DNA-binding response OmpR family regulator
MKENIKGKKILIIEDEEPLADVLSAKLEKEGYDVTIAGDGDKGYKTIKEWKPDLVLLDIVMPKMDGYEVLEQLNRDNNRTPVIIISNSGQPVEIEKTRKLGAVDHLIKTEFDPQEVVSKVRHYLGGEAEDKKPKSDETELKPLSENSAAGLNVKVLLVEDDNFLRSICSKKLAKEGFTVYEALDGEMAVREVEKIKPDIVLLDIILPAIDGFEVLQKIRQSREPKVKAVPVIMLSNLGQDDDIKKALTMGANDYLVKAHFTIEEIVTKVRKVLNI